MDKLFLGLLVGAIVGCLIWYSLDIGEVRSKFEASQGGHSEVTR